MDQEDRQEWIAVLDRLDDVPRSLLLQFARSLIIGAPGERAAERPRRLTPEELAEIDDGVRKAVAIETARGDGRWTAEREAAQWADERTRLRSIRRHFGLSEQQMALRLEMNVRSYRAWETGPRKSFRGGTDFVLRLCREFGLSIDWYMTGGEPRNDRRPFGPNGEPLPLMLKVLAGNGP